jgi:hypothetical protein
MFIGPPPSFMDPVLWHACARPGLVGASDHSHDHREGKGAGQSFEGEAESVVDAPPSKVRLKASLVTLRLTAPRPPSDAPPLPFAVWQPQPPDPLTVS